MTEQTPRRIAGLAGKFDSLESYMEYHRQGRQDRTPRGANHSNAKLTEAQVAEIRRIYAEGKTDAQQLAEVYGVSASSIDNIVNGATWGHVKDEITEEQLAAIKKARRTQNVAKATDATRKLTEDDVRAIRAEYVPGIGKKLAEKYGVSQPTISDIITRRRWNHI